jgi:hypothetical protein
MAEVCMSSPAAVPSPSLPTWRRKLEDIFGLDVRSLALLRIGLALMLLWDVYIRYQDLHAHYTDEGVLPRHVLPLHHLPLSVHLLGGSTTFQAVLFYLEGLVALALLVGWQTRYATMLAWFLTISLHARNPVVIQGGDIVLRMLLFWGMFLPLGASYSLDAMSRPPPSRRVANLATTALILQICILYWFAALLKWDPVWRSQGYAVFMALSVGHFTTAIGDLILPHRGLMSFLTYMTLVQEGLVPFLLFIPWRTWVFRLLVIATFVGFHAGLGLCMELGNFQPLCMIAWLALLPSEFWDGLAARLRRPAREGLRLLQAADDGPAHECIRLWTTVLMLRDVPVAVIPPGDPEYERVRAGGGWLAVAGDGSTHARGDALLLLWRASPIGWPPTVLLGWAALRGLRDWLAGAGGPGGAAAPLRPPAPDRPPLVRPLAGLTNLAIVVLLLYIVAWNMRTWPEPHSGEEARTPWGETYIVQNSLPLEWLLTARDQVRELLPIQNTDLGFALGLDQNWALFAAYPGTVHGWFVVPGTLKSGRQVDLLPYALEGRVRDVSWQRPARIADVYPNSRWRKYLMNLIGLNTPDLPLRHYFAVYLCNLWNAEHPDPRDQLVKVEVHLMREDTQPDYQPVKLSRWILCKLDCTNMESNLDPEEVPLP